MSRYRGNDEACPCCGQTYGDLRTGLTYRDVWLMFWGPQDAPRDEWRHKTRGVILGKWHEIKRDMWSEHLERCDVPF